MTGFDELLRDIRFQLLEGNFIQLINGIPGEFFQLNDFHRKTVMREIRHVIVCDNQKDPEKLVEIINRYMAKVKFNVQPVC